MARRKRHEQTRKADDDAEPREDADARARRTRCPAAASRPSRFPTPTRCSAPRSSRRSRRGSRSPTSRSAVSGGRSGCSGGSTASTRPPSATRTGPRRTPPTTRSARPGPATPRRCWSPSTRSKVSYADLLKVFFEEHDPTQGMRQGNDVGTQYRSGIYFANDAQKATAEMARDAYDADPARRRARSRSRPRSSRPGPSTTPRSTTSSTCTRSRTATAAWPEPASPAASRRAASYRGGAPRAR